MLSSSLSSTWEKAWVLQRGQTIWVIFMGTGHAASCLWASSAATMLSLTPVMTKDTASSAVTLASCAAFSATQRVAISAGDHFFFLWLGVPGCFSSIGWPGTHLCEWGWHFSGEWDTPYWTYITTIPGFTPNYPLHQTLSGSLAQKKLQFLHCKPWLPGLEKVAIPECCPVGSYVFSICFVMVLFYVFLELDMFFF